MADDWSDIPHKVLWAGLVNLHVKELAPIVAAERKDREERNEAANAKKGTDELSLLRAEIAKLKAEKAALEGK